MYKYPTEIASSVLTLINKPCLYMLEVEPGIYKYGISEHIRNRLRKHYRDMKFLRIVNIYNCEFNSIMRKVEAKLGHFAKNNGEKVKKYDKTEIISTQNIEQYLDFIPKSINTMIKLPQPENRQKLKQLIVPSIKRKSILKNANKKTINVNVHDQNVDHKKCDSCEKVFRTPIELQRHKNRKTPCLIKEISEDQKLNPNRCIFCNKIFSKKSNLIKHHKGCKIKNIDVKIIDENIEYEQEIRILKEQREIDRKEIEKLHMENKEIKEINKRNDRRFEKLEKLLLK